GAGAPRVVGTTIARDLYGGRPLARVLSLVMTVFMAVPIIAPLAGQGIMAAAGWEAIFGLYFLLAVISGGWYLLGVPETLAREHRRPFRLGQMLSAYAEVLTTRQTLGCALATALVFGPFVVYLATAQQVLEELYQLGPLFPLAFSSVAVAFAAATFLNAQIVMRVGMRRAAMAGFSITLSVSSAVALGMLSGLIPPVPPIWAYLGLICAIFMAVAILMTNLTALALDPMGHLSGTASAVINATSALGSSLIGLVIAQLYDGTLLPMFLGFSVLGLSGFALFLWATARSEAHG
ncbi:MAG: MFS transporter, partial [Pseudomonadota bacterium]